MLYVIIAIVVALLNFTVMNWATGWRVAEYGLVPVIGLVSAVIGLYGAACALLNTGE